MGKKEYPLTRGVRLLRSRKIDFVAHLYPYQDRGGTRQSAACLAVDEHQVIKTLVFEGPAGKPFLVLMHGDCEVSTKQLARELGVKSIKPASVADAQRVTGYQVGGLSPFGTRQSLKVYVERSIMELERFYINGGQRGFLVEITPADLRQVLAVQEVAVAIKV